MKKLAITLAVALMSAMTLNAQDNTSEPATSGKFYVVGGVHYINTVNLNKQLVANGLPELGKVYSAYGFGGCWRTGKWTFGGEGMSLSGSEVDNDEDDQSAGDVKLSATVGMGYLYVGYTVLESGQFHLTPTLGVGGSGVTLLMNYKSETTLDDFLSGTSANNLTTGGALIHSGVKFGYLFSDHWDLNLDIGYNYGIGNEWNTSYGELSESVKDGIGGAYAQITFGYVFN